MRFLVTLVILSPAIGVVIVHPWTHSADASTPKKKVVAARPKTVEQIVRPVTAQGAPADGWSVQAEQMPDGFRCVGSSPVAVDPGIATCGAPEDFTIACWKSTDRTVLCLRDPKVKRLARIGYAGSFPSSPAPTLAIPLEVGLRYFGTCMVRDGGAALTPPAHPTWTATYACASSKHGLGYLVGPRSGSGGIDRSTRLWTVHWKNAHRPNGKIVKDRVVTAYVVGNAS
ncbi:hypothetical protein [Jatrophihabitans fulvus]